MVGLVTTPINRILSRGWRHQYFGVFVPVFVYLAVSHEQGKLAKTSTYIVAFALALLISRFPVAAVTALVSFMPLNVFAFSYLLKLGVPAGFLHQARSWKELLVAGLIIAAWRSHRERPRAFDRLDWAGFAYLVCVFAYYAFPHLFAFGQPILSHATRYAALRDDTEFVIALLAARHVGLRRSALKPIAMGLLLSGGLVAFGGVYQHLRQSSWTHFLVSTMQVPQYWDKVLHTPIQPTNILDFDSGHLRVGSVLFSPIVLGPYLLIPFGLAVERIGRRAAGVLEFVVAALCGGAILYSGTRSSVIGLLLIPILALRPAPGRTVVTRLRLGAAVLILLVVGAPVAGKSGIINRTSAAIAGSDGSANGHFARFHTGVHQIAKHPLGGGLGTVGGLGQTNDPTGGVTAEDYYLQVGDELGIHTMIAFALVTIFMLIALHRSVDGRSGMEASGGVWLSAVALGFGAFLLHIWAGLTISLPFWALAGAVIGAADMRRLGDPGTDAPMPVAAGRHRLSLGRRLPV